MKLAYISNATVPDDWAHTLQIMKMCQAFAEVGHAVELIVPKRRTALNKNPFEYYGIKEIFTIKKIPCIDIFPGSDNKLLFFLRLSSFLIGARIYIFFRRPDVIYTREQFANIFFKNVIFEIHSLPKKTKSFHKWIWKRAKLLVVVTGFIKKRLVEYGVPEQKIMVEHDAVNISEFVVNGNKEQIRKKLNLPQNISLIGYVGTLKTMAMEKGVDIAIKALPALGENCILCLVGGEKSDIEYYRNMAKSLGVEPRVIFAGKVPHTSVPEYLKAFDIVVAPFPENEHYNFYMSPLKIFEYMASERPIVVSDLPSIREVLNEKNSILVKPNNVESYVQAIRKLSNDPLLSVKIAKQAFEDVQNCTWLKRAERILHE